MLALAFYRQSVKHEVKYNSKPGKLLHNANLQTLYNLIFHALLDLNKKRFEVIRNETFNFDYHTYV